MTTPRKILKQLAGSGTFTAITVTQTLKVIINSLLAGLAGFIGSELILSNADGMTGIFGYTGYYYMDADVLETLAIFLPLVFVITALLLSVPQIINTIAFWIIRKNARTENLMLRTTGFTILLTINIIFFVIFCVSAVVSLVTMVFQTASASIFALAGYGGTSAVFGLLAVILSVVAIGVVYVIEFIKYLKIFKSINVARNIIKTDKSDKKPSRFLACLCFIDGALFIAESVFVLVLALPVGGMLNIMPLVLCSVLFFCFVCSAVFSFACGSLVLKARKRLLELENPIQTYGSAEEN